MTTTTNSNHKSVLDIWNETEKKVERFHNTSDKFLRFVEQTVMDYYRHAIDIDTYSSMVFVLCAISHNYCNHDSWSLSQYIDEREKVWKEFYSDSKTVSALMAYSD